MRVIYLVHTLFDMKIPLQLRTLYNNLYRSRYSKYFIPSVSIVIVLIFFWQYIATGDSIRMGDFDYYTQLYEAFRISLLHYGQFPDWNPWLAGGTPLYANPQFGLISIQSVFVLFFGSVYGLKLAYVFYAILGFIGVYVLGRQLLHSSQIRASLIGLLWVMCGFFTSHNISHFTFALFFLLPWLFFLIYNRHKIRYSWLLFGCLLALIGLSSLHYAALMMGLVISIFAIINFVRISQQTQPPSILFIIKRDDIVFTLKSAAVFAILIAHKLYATMAYLANNERVINSPETYPTIGLLIKTIFMPVDTMKLPIPEGIHSGWGWGEYSMYISLGASLALIVGSIYGIVYYLKYKKLTLQNPHFFIAVGAVAAICFCIALGDYGKFSFFNILQHLPGFSQTRVPSRWMIFVVFAILCFLMSLKRPRYFIDGLLIVGVLELFIFFGPLHVNGTDMFAPQKGTFSKVIEQYDNDKKHQDINDNPLRSYYVSTTQNIGQVYADDSIINTLNGVYNTSRCGENKAKSCSFIMSNNASVEYWSPNLIRIKRTSSGPIELNMNPYYGWYINEVPAFTSQTRLDPDARFLINDTSSEITISYRAKGSLGQIVKRF